MVGDRFSVMSSGLLITTDYLTEWILQHMAKFCFLKELTCICLLQA